MANVYQVNVEAEFYYKPDLTTKEKYVRKGEKIVKVIADDVESAISKAVATYLPDIANYQSSRSGSKYPHHPDDYVLVGYKVNSADLVAANVRT